MHGQAHQRDAAYRQGGETTAASNCLQAHDIGVVGARGHEWHANGQAGSLVQEAVQDAAICLDENVPPAAPTLCHSFARFCRVDRCCGAQTTRLHSAQISLHDIQNLAHWCRGSVLAHQAGGLESDLTMVLLR